MQKIYDVAVVGAGACGMIASLIASYEQKSVLLVEKMPQIGLKLKASGGGRCNLTNTLDKDSFIEAFGKNGKFIQDAIEEFDNHQTIKFFNSLGVETKCADGFRIFPASHSSATVIQALQDAIDDSTITLKLNTTITDIAKDDIFTISSAKETFYAYNLIIATGGLGYESLGSSGDGYKLANRLNHTTTPTYPAMLPLKCKESWVGNCRADTIAKATIKIDIKKYAKLKATGDLIFTKDGIRGPVVLDFAREITPLLDKYDSIPIKLNLTQRTNIDEIIKELKASQIANPTHNTLQLIQTMLPISVALELCKLSNIKPQEMLKNQDGKAKDKLYSLLAWVPLEIIDSYGWQKAMVTRGGVKLKEINPKTMQSKITPNLYFCGEVIDIDGPCGGFNLQWCFSSGYLAGKLKK